MFASQVVYRTNLLWAKVALSGGGFHAIGYKKCGL